ncbi:MAG: hypothetical protein FJ296_10260, partial [Planctomycetes bacterium]|nr:hypothetical protein [Planctomycetota bacterium]
MKRALGALVLLAALVAAWWLVRTTDTEAPAGSHVLHEVPRTRDVVELPAPDDQRLTTSGAASDSPVAAAPLITTAALTVAPPPGVILAAPARVELTRTGDGWRDVRTILDAAGAIWRELPPGRYRLRALGTAWDVPAADLELAAGAERAVELRPLTLLAGRVLGSRSGQPVTGFELRVWRRAHEGPEAGEHVVLHRGQVADADGRFALGGLELPAEPSTEVQAVAVTDARVTVASAWLDLPPDARWSSIELRATEASVVGRVRLAGVPETKRFTATVSLVNEVFSLQLLHMDEDGAPWLATNQERPSRLAGSDTDSSGRYVIAQAIDPAGPQRLLAVSKGWLPFLSEPLSIPSTGPPLELDVTLQQGGRVEGTVNLPSGAPGASRPAAWPTLVVAR